ncbi:MAG: hypothetical protein KIS92_22130 [Planctomycetota bacterium]|nr:hypothetical protein [Planctomycetota bacterium]
MPIANLVVQVLMWMAVAKRRGKPDWYGALVLVPCFGIFITPGLLAFSE